MIQVFRFAAVLAMSATGLVAHDLYLLPDLFQVQKGATIRIAVHNGDSFPASEVAPVIARLRDTQLLGKAGMSVVHDIQAAGKEVSGKVLVPGGGSLLLSTRTIPNLIELEADKFLEYLKEEGLTEVMAWREKHAETAKPGRERYSKFAKSLLRGEKPDDFYRHVLGFPIEIVPEADPGTVHAGGKLPVRVLFRGKPAPGFQMEAAWSSGGKSKTTIIGRTNAEGDIEVPIAQAGKWRLHSLHMERCADPTFADWESYRASLTFETN